VTPENGSRYPVYVRKIRRTWWLRTGPFRRFAAREITSMFGAAFSAIMLLFLFALSRGTVAYGSFLRWLQTPWSIALSAIILVAVLYHTATWFRLTTRILSIRLGRRTVSRGAIAAGLVLAWIAASALVAYFHVWF